MSSTPCARGSILLRPSLRPFTRTLTFFVGYGFVETANAELATIAVNMMSDSVFRGSILKIKRPKDYVPSLESDHSVVSRLVPGYKVAIARPVPRTQCAQDVPPSPTRLYIGNIAPIVTEDELKDFCNKYADIKAFRLVKADESDEMSLGYAFVEFQEPEDNLIALFGLRGVEFCGKRLAIFLADSPPSLLPALLDALEVEGGPPATDLLPASVEIPADPEDWYSSRCVGGLFAKPLEAPVTRILEISGCFPDIDTCRNHEEVAEIEEDVRAECDRFGLTWSTHCTRLPPRRGAAGEQIEHDDDKDGPLVGKEAAPVGATNDDDDEKVTTTTKGKTTTTTSKGTKVTVAYLKAELSKRGLSTAGLKPELAARLQAAVEVEVELEVKAEEADEGALEEVEPAAVAGAAAGVAVKAEEEEEEEEEERAEMKPDPLATTTGEEEAKEVDESALVGVGKVYVEFARKETACDAAFRLHGRPFGGSQISARFFPLKTFQRQFNKGIQPSSLSDRIRLALAVQGRITDVLYQDVAPGAEKPAYQPLIPVNRREVFWNTDGGYVVNADKVEESIIKAKLIADAQRTGMGLPTSLAGNPALLAAPPPNPQE